MRAAQCERGFGGAARERRFEPRGGDAESRRRLRWGAVEEDLQDALTQQRHERARAHDAAGAQHEDAAGDALQRSQVAGGEQNGDARGGKPRDAGAQIPAGERIESRQGLVEQQDAARAERRLREGEAVQIDATEGGRARVGDGGEPRDVERVMDERPARGRGAVEAGVVGQDLPHGERRREDRRLTTLSSVVFPAPAGPTIPMISPGSSASDTKSSGQGPETSFNVSA